MQSVCSPVTAGTLEAGDDAHVAGDDLSDDVGQDHGVVTAVAPGHEADVVAAHVLEIQMMIMMTMMMMTNVTSDWVSTVHVSIISSASTRTGTL